MSKKRILFFAHYYSPDTASTGQLLKDQAEGMLKEFVTRLQMLFLYQWMILSRN